MRPICMLVGALGGQGGGVLVDWLVDAARKAGYHAQGSSTPGVAQRTGATTYYFELFPEKNPEKTPIFTFFPGSDDLDLMVAMEPTEAGRAIERGFVTKFTTVLSATDRVYSTAEKVSAGDGRINIVPVISAIEKASKKLVQLDLSELSSGTSARGNAIVLGAIIGSGILPLTADECRDSIKSKNVAVESNLAGFDIGLKAIKNNDSVNSSDPDLVFKKAPSEFDEKIALFPENAHEIISHGISRLIDYQDSKYADFYLERLKKIHAANNSSDEKLISEVARHLARWMSFEDVIRVAQLKTRPGRLARIRNELNISEQIPLKVTDYFKPGREEFMGMLPKSISWLIPNIGKLKKGRGISLHLPTGSAFGYGMLKILSSFKPFRAKSAQYKEEQEVIEIWLAAITAAANVNEDLACQTAALAILARGYGPVRKSGLEKLILLFCDWDARLKSDKNGLSIEVDQHILLAHSNPDAT